MDEPDPVLTGKKKWNGLSVDGMIFIALCSGGDYHPVSYRSGDESMKQGLIGWFHAGWNTKLW
jgi:hypothetical protein